MLLAPQLTYVVLAVSTLVVSKWLLEWDSFNFSCTRFKSDEQYFCQIYVCYLHITGAKFCAVLTKI